MQTPRTMAATGVAAGLAAGADTRRAEGVATWLWPAAALAIVAACLAPFLVVDAPAVLDYPNHLARFYILAHPHDPILSRMYAPHWSILPNIGADLLGAALLSFMPADVGGRIVLALSLLAPLVGAAVYARAAFGRWTWWSLGAGAIAYNGVFFLGFMNFQLGLGVALAGAGAWRLLRRQGRDRTAMAAGAAIGLAAFFCHLLGYAFFALLIAAQEVEELAPRLRRREVSGRSVVAAAARLATALAPAAALYLLTHQPNERGDRPGWNWAAKAFNWLIPFMTYSTLATTLTAAVVIGLAIMLWRGANRASGVTLALVVLGGLYAIAPAQAGGGTFVDARLPLMAALALFAGVSPRVTPAAAKAFAAVFALLIAGRAAIVAVHWNGHARDLAELRAQLAYVTPGAAILPAWTGAALGEETSGRELPHFTPLNDNLPALAVIERRAFWPLEFADPTQQPLVVRAPYSAIAQPSGWSTPWVRLLDNPATPAEVAEHAYLSDWRGRFNFVLLTGPPPAGPTPAGLALIRAGPATSLYRVVR